MSANGFPDIRFPDILPALKWIKDYVWPDIKAPLAPAVRFGCIALGTSLYALYQNLMNPEIAVFRQAVAALPPLLGFAAAVDDVVLYIAANVAAISITAGLLAYPEVKAPPAMLAFVGVFVPVIVQLLLNSGLGG